MKLICAGLPKTGTKSVAAALRILGYNVHDIEEQWIHHLDEYLDAMENNQIPDFATMYANVDAVTDIPASSFWEDIFTVFPDAKVLLMIRDNENVWSESLRKTHLLYYTVLSSVWMKLGFLCTPTGRKWARFIPAFRKKLALNSNAESGYHPDRYRKHNARVQSTIPRDQLLVYNVKQGWKPLCEFLGVEVPDVPFPRLNVNSDMIKDIWLKSQLQERMTRELSWILGLIVLIGALVFYWLISF